MKMLLSVFVCILRSAEPVCFRLNVFWVEKKETCFSPRRPVTVKKNAPGWNSSSIDYSFHVLVENTSFMQADCSLTTTFVRYDPHKVPVAGCRCSISLHKSRSFFFYINLVGRFFIIFMTGFIEYLNFLFLTRHIINFHLNSFRALITCSYFSGFQILLLKNSSLS